MLRYNSQRLEYMTSRGFTGHTLQKYEITYDEQMEAVIFPIRDRKGSIRFLKRRSVKQKQFFNDRDIFRKDIVYGLYYLVNAPKPITKIYLTESETDTMACYQAGLAAGALQGRVLYDEQIKELLLAGMKEIVLFLDNDTAGIEATKRAEEKLLKFPFRVSRVVYPSDKYKDANDLLWGGRIKNIEERAYDYNRKFE
jgi:DNA primase